MLRQSLQQRCRSFTRCFSSLPTNVPVPPAAEEPTYNLKEVARRKRKTEWKRRQGVRHVQPIPRPHLLTFSLFYTGTNVSRPSDCPRTRRERRRRLCRVPPRTLQTLRSAIRWKRRAWGRCLFPPNTPPYNSLFSISTNTRKSRIPRSGNVARWSKRCPPRGQNSPWNRRTRAEIGRAHV